MQLEEWRRPRVLLALAALASTTWLGTARVASAQTPVFSSQDFEYLGAFLIPPGEDLSYCKGVKAYDPEGDPDGPSDGFPGSLFGTGHVQFSPAFEVSIPAPVNSRNVADLPTAQLLQAPVELVTQIELGTDDELKGMEYLPAQGPQTKGKLYVSFGRHYQYNRRETHGWTETSLTSPNAAGPWFVGPESMVNDMNTNEYIFKIPQRWSDEHVPGKRLACGRMRGGQLSAGPTIIAFGPWNDGNPPPPSTELDAVPLLLYELGACQCPNCEGHHDGDCLTGYCEDDNWWGGAWLDDGTKSAVAIVGVKGYGECWYGYSDGSTCPPVCSGGPGNRGYFAERYETTILLYNPDDLAAVAAGTMEADQPQPYEFFDITPYMLQYPVDDPLTKIYAAGTAYDADRGFLYVTEQYGNGIRPVVHVWRVGNTVPDTTPPADIDDLGAAPGAPGEIELTWTAPGDDDTTGRAITYLVRRSDSSIDTESDWAAATVVGGAPAPQPGGSSESMTVTGLSPSTTYFFSVRARDDALNLGGLSNSPSATTVADTSPPVLSNVQAVESAPGTLHVTWTTNEPADSNLEWDDAYGGSGPLANIVENGLLVTSHAVDVNGLSAGSRVYYRASSTDANDNTGFDVVRYLDMQAADTTPPAITFGPAVSVDPSATSAGILWNTNEPAVGWVQWGTSPSYGQTTATTTVYSTSHYHVLFGLANGQTIYYRVHVRDASGNEAVGNAESFEVAVDLDAPEVGSPVIVTTASQALYTFVADEPSFGSFSWGIDPGNLSNVVLLASYSQPALTHSVLTEGLIATTTYYWRLSLSDLSGNTGETEGELYFSGDGSYDTAPPNAPNGLYIADFTEQAGVALQWAPNSESDLAGYDVHRRPIADDGDPTGPWGVVNGSVLTDTAFLDDSIASGASYEYVVVARDVSQNESAPSAGVEFDPAYWQALRSFLSPARPNPFSLGSSTQIDFLAPAVSRAPRVHAEVTVYDIVGRRVASLFRGPMSPGESRSALWNGRDQAGLEVAAGVYFVQLRVGNETQSTRKITVLR